MSHETETREPFEIVGLETRASNEDPGPIGALWERFLADDELKEGDRIVAVYCDYEGDHTRPYTFFLGRPVADGVDFPASLARRWVVGGRFARFVAEGEQPAALIATWRRIWETPLERRYDHDYEIHHAGDPSRVEIYVGVAS
jgi:predicted transcriptional regulator YdeE